MIQHAPHQHTRARSAKTGRLLHATWFAALVVLVVWSDWQFKSAEQAVNRVVENLHVCRGLADQISKLKVRPSQAMLQTQSTKELAERIDQAAQAVGLGTKNLARIEPQAVRRLGDTAYKEQPTTVDIVDTTLQQLVAFLYQLSQDGQDLHIKSIRLHAPRHQFAQSDTDERWQAEVILTYVIYDPKTPASTL